MTAWLLERAWLGPAAGTRDDVLVEVEDGSFTRVEPGARDAAGAAGATRLAGLTLPGFANAHSHAFHRALRGRTQRERGTFWTWREQMYAVAARLDPDLYLRLARAVYREMAASGTTTVGEFHYLHHQPDGTPYADPNEMSAALVQAARDAGVRITLLDTCYLSSGFGAPPEGAQVRYSDGDVGAWRDRLEAARGLEADGVVLGAAVHSVRAVPAADLPAFADVPGPLHAHVSEQRAENEACLAHHGRTPVGLLADAGLLGPRFTAVHATHLTDGPDHPGPGADVALLGGSGAHACFCPTTERDLGDGVGPGRRLAEAGATITLGSDSHAVVDPFEEMRALEMDERLAREARGHWTAADLLAAGTGHGSLGFADAGAIAVGLRADLVTLDTATPRTAGTGADEHTAAFAATAADVLRVVCDGRTVFERGQEQSVGRELDEAVAAVWREVAR